ncbi:integrase arm-type DNA-binding domain-containing protein [Brucella sp. MAB-22]|uniref:tyrosine-type recombinase/integrase n=1 Tax=Brucella sp. MAB-22 TaxID=2986424 RepID=UPI002220B851|nr:site-specific integrase [Brucella sp. MAB-22]UYT56166.1 integrase arm-type DNA-binding domain-containing protein [Brucella sp. MAB-22]
MAKPINKFSAKAVEALSKPGRHSDGGGLYLKVLPDGRRQWVFMYRWQGKQKEMGLGAFLPVKTEKGQRYEYVTLAEARQKATDARAAIAQDVDPMQARNTASGVPLFGEFADNLIDDLASGFRNEKHLEQWRMTLGDTYCKSLRSKRVDQITTADVLEVLKPIWQKKAETASRIRGRIERVLNAAKAKGHRSGENPAMWRGHLANLLPKRQKLQRGHHAAMPFEDVPAFLAGLRDRPATAARALEFTILTAARSGEVYGATWSEIDLKAQVWTVKAARMKAGRDHRVPLTPRAVAILEELKKLGSEPDAYVFPGQKRDRPLSNMAMDMIMRRMKIDVTVHGFRSSFRDWAGEVSTFPREIAEAALAHVVGDETERAYRRGDALAKRRKMMEAWANYCEPKGKNVLAFKRSSKS